MKIDFNLLVILNAVIECKSVSLAAKQLATSPSSITYSINKLRALTLNPIFTRSKHGVKPTTLAVELNERYKKAIALIGESLSIDIDNLNSETPRTITISTYTFVELWISLIAFTKKPTTLNFTLHPITNEERLTNLRNRETDIDIGAQLPNDHSIVSYKLCTSKYKVMVSKKHSSITDNLTKEQWLQNNHITWSRIRDETSTHMGDAQIIDELISRKVGVMSHSSLNMLMLSAQSDYLMLIPEYFAEFACSILPVKIFDIPFETNMESTLFFHIHISAAIDPSIEEYIQILRNLSVA